MDQVVPPNLGASSLPPILVHCRTGFYYAFFLVITWICCGAAHAQVIRRVSAGNCVTFCLRDDGTVWKIGSPTQQVGISTPVVSIAAGDGQTGPYILALDQNDQVWSISPFSGVPAQVPSASGIVDLAAADYYRYAVKSDGTVLRWDDSAQTPTAIPSLSDVISVAASGGDVIFLKSNGSVIARNPQSGSLETVVGISDGIDVACGGYSVPFYLVLRSNGTVLAWGGNSSGQLGNGSTDDAEFPTPVVGLTNVVKIAAGGSHAMALTGDASVWTWGRNIYGQLGFGDASLRVTPTKLTSLTGIIDIDASTGFEDLDHSVALKSDGSVWGWGNDWGNQLGDAQVLLPSGFVTTLLSGVLMLQRVNNETTALRSDGTLWVWGCNGNDNGYDSSRFNTLPARLNNLENVQSFSVSGDPSSEIGTYTHSLAVKNDGSIWGWGTNDGYRLGVSTQPPDYNTPFQLPGVTNVKEASAGVAHSVMVKNDGTVWTCGYGVRVAMTQVSGLNGVISVRAGPSGWSLALTETGNVWAWTGASGTPVQIQNLSDIASIDCKKLDETISAVALKEDGTVWRFQGANPATVVTDLTDVIAVSAYNLAVKSDGTVWTWGTSAGSQLTGVERVVEASPGVAIKEDGTVYTWLDGGYNSDRLGVLGEGLGAAKTSPTAFLRFNVTHLPPQVAINGGTGLAIGQPHTITATFTPGSGTSAAVYFYHHGRLIGEDNSSPYSFQFVPPTWGTFKISAIGVDSNGVYSARSAQLTLQVPYNSDNDDLPDWWEQEYLGNLVSSGNEDPDGDGYSNLEEYLNGTNPLVFDGPPNGTDTDEDGLTDSQEALAGTKPDWKDHPAVQLKVQTTTIP